MLLCKQQKLIVANLNNILVGWVKQQRNPTHLLGYGFATLRERTSTQPTNQDFFRFGQGIVDVGTLSK